MVDFLIIYAIGIMAAVFSVSSDFPSNNKDFENKKDRRYIYLACSSINNWTWALGGLWNSQTRPCSNRW